MEFLNSKNLDAYIVTNAVNRRYLTGFTGSAGTVFVSKSEKKLIVDGRYTIQAKQQAQDFEICTFKKSPFEFIDKENIKCLGFEEKNISYTGYKKLKNEFPDAEFIDISDDIENKRIIKTESEILKIKKAAQIADNAFTHILNFIKPGRSEKEIAIELEFFMRKNGAEGLSFDTIAASGENSALPHAFPTDRVIKSGEFVLLDYGCKFEGYCSDMTRTVAVGNISDEKKEFYETVLKAQQTGLNSLRENFACKDADKAVRDFFASEKCEKLFTHSLGHGVGLEIHEEPTLSPKSEKILKSNMVVTVEPGLYKEGFCGVRIEDLVYINGNSYVNLTKSAKNLIIL